MADILTIIQGSNDPVQIEFYADDDIDESLDFHIAIFTQDRTQIAHWTLEEIIIDGTTVYCPLTQDETIAMPAGGGCYLEMKRTRANGRLRHYERIPVVIEDRTDKHILRETAEAGE